MDGSVSGTTEAFARVKIDALHAASVSTPIMTSSEVSIITRSTSDANASAAHAAIAACLRILSPSDLPCNATPQARFSSTGC